MQPSSFDAFIGIDWSGARPPCKGIAVARCSPDSAVSLVAPPSRLWTRASTIDWIAGSVARGERLLVGFDFAFGLPWNAERGYLDGRAADVTTAFALWDRIEEASALGADFYAGACLDDPRLSPSFWIRGKMPPWWGDGSERQRWTERACAATTGTHPVSVLKIAAASKQVGKGSLAGMRCLRALRGRLGARVAVWPFEPIAGRSVCVEIFPTLFRKAATGATRKLTSRSEMSSALERLDASVHREVPSHFDDHEGDALVSAAGLRSVIRREPRPFAIPRVQAARVAREGMIFGMHEGAHAIAASRRRSRVG